MIWVKIIRIDFDDIWQKHSKYSRIEFTCFSFYVGLLFLSTFRLSGRTPKIALILMLHECKGYNWLVGRLVGWLGFNGILSTQVAVISCLRKFKVC